MRLNLDKGHWALGEFPTLNSLGIVIAAFAVRLMKR